MDSHKPNPRRKWPGFFKEVGIVVLGVGLALGAQQAADAWREHQQYLEARAAVRQELATNLTNLLRREAIKGCIAQRVAEIGALLDKAGNGGAFEPAKSIPRTNNFYVDTFAFSAASQAGRASLFPQDELRGYGRLYVRQQHIADYQDMQINAWIHLAPLRGKGRIGPEMLLAFGTALEEARAADILVSRQVAQFRDEAAQLGITGQTARNPIATSMCTPISEEAREPA